MRVHRFLQAKNAEPRNSGGADRALTFARSLTKLAASPLHRPPVSMQEFVVLALLIATCACEDNAVRGGCPNARQSMGCECTSDRDVHSQLRSFDVTEFGVASDQCTRLTANTRYSSLRSDSPCAQPTRSCTRCPMFPLCVQSAPALTNSIGNVQWETEPLQHESAEEMRFHLKLFLSWSSTDDVAGTWSGM